MQNPVEILLWKDRFWCYRELRTEFLRDYSYRVIPSDTDEWYEFARHRPPSIDAS